MEAGVEEYWIVDPEQRSVTVVSSGARERTERERLTWAPVTASSNLLSRLSDIFG